MGAVIACVFRPGWGAENADEQRRGGCPRVEETKSTMARLPYTAVVLWNFEARSASQLSGL